MSLAESMLAEFEAQAPITRKFLERLPEDRLTWKPHKKSMSAGQLAYHLASVPGGVVRFVQTIRRKLQSLPVFSNQRAARRSSRRLRKVSPQCGAYCQSTMTRQ